MRSPGEARPGARRPCRAHTLAPPQPSKPGNAVAATGRHYSLGGAVFAAVAIAVVVSIATGSAQAFAHYGMSFVWSGTCSPGTGKYAAGILVVGHGS